MDMNSEPARIVGIITAIVTALLLLLVEFGVPLTDGQQTAIQGLVAALAPVVAGYIIREKVYAPDTVREIVQSERKPKPKIPVENWGIYNRVKKDEVA